MQILTALILAAFVGYAGAWYTGFLEGNFALLLFWATAITGVYWLAEHFYFLPNRRRAVAQLEADSAQRHEILKRQGIHYMEEDTSKKSKRRLMTQPWWLDWTAGLFPVIAVVFLLRSFVFEPFKIPSGSMIPTLWVGDLILVNKFTYGLRLPVLNTKLTEGKPVQRGDVMVFRYPPKPNLDYIKRVVGIPGDTVVYLNKRLTVNGKPVPTAALPDFFDEDLMHYFKQFEETVGDKKHRILTHDERPAGLSDRDVGAYAFRENCAYSTEGVVCKVPAGHYFMMGDNRDNSQDSRYWGFVPEKNIVGKAVLVWMNFSYPQRIGFFD